MEAKSSLTEKKKPTNRKSAFGAYLTSPDGLPVTTLGGQRHPFETGTPANPALLKKGHSFYSQKSQDVGRALFQVGAFPASAVQERLGEIAEELRITNARFDLFREEAALKERGLILAFEKIKAKCLDMKRNQEVMVSAYNKKCAVINSLNERIYGEAAKAKLEVMWDDETLKRIYGVEGDGSEDELLDMDIDLIQKSSAILESKRPRLPNGERSELTNEKAERDKTLAMRKVLLRRYIKNRSDSAELGQLRRKHTATQEDAAFESIRNRLMTKNFQGDTVNLVFFEEKSNQTQMSFGNPKYEKILLSQNELDLYHQRMLFEERIQLRANSSNFMYFLTDEVIKSMFDKEIWDLSNQTAMKPIEMPVEDCELIKGLKEVDKEGELEDKSIKRKTVLKNGSQSENGPSEDAIAEDTGVELDKFKLERLEDHINFKVHLQMPVNENLMKYLYISYIYVLYDRKKKQDLVGTRESQIQVLMNICSKLKSKIAESDFKLQKYKQHIEVFNDLHKDCKVGSTLVDYISDPAELENLEKDKKHMQVSAVSATNTDERDIAAGGDDAVAGAMENLMLRVWKIKAVSKEKNKKYMSFKFVYEKIHRFFQIRLQEVEFQEAIKVDHPYSLEEHFFRILTEKDVTVKKVEEKIKNFIVTLMNLKPNSKLTIMKKFLKLMPGGLFYGPVEEYVYLRCIEYIKTESRGLEVPINTQNGTNFVSYEKFEGFLVKYIHPRLNPKTIAQLNKALRGHLVTVTDPSLGLLAKKGLIDLDDGLEEVLKWTLAKSEHAKPSENFMDLFAILDISFVGRLSFQEFSHLYDCFTKKGPTERSKFLVQLDHFAMENPVESDELPLQSQLGLSTFHAQLRTLKNYAGTAKLFDPIQKFSPEYVHSSEEIKQIFYKNAIEGLDGTSECYLTFLNFCNV